MKRMGRRTAIQHLAALTATAVPPWALGGDERPPYRNPALPVAQRVQDLLSRMTLEEKVGQTIALWFRKADIIDAGSIEFSATKASRSYPAGFGQITRASDWRGVTAPPARRARSSEESIRFVNDLQRWATTQTRLGIPVLVHEETLHGYMAPGGTMFPVPLALAGSFDRELVREVHRITARETRAHGAHLALAPVVDIARDPRWGRIEETFGEDPYLCAEMGVAGVLGLQGDSRTLAPGRVLATLKHMTGHGQPQSGNNAGPAPLSERELRESFFPPFREAVARTPVAVVMPSYNEVDGVPSHANAWMLNTVLRGEWHFDGLVLSDYNAVAHLQSLHRVAADLPTAGLLALQAGVDSETPDGAAFRSLADLLRAGRIDAAAIDTACARMLALKFHAGLFENPYADTAEAVALTGNDEARALALRAAQRSICLLKNDGLLPLAAGAHRRVAVIGPSAAIARLGGYSSEPKNAVSLLAGVRARLAGRAEVLHAQGVFITRSEDRSASEVLLADAALNQQLIAEAVAVAKTADVILLAIGDTEQTSREGFATNHLGDRAQLDLLGEQNALFDALHALAKPIVVLAINGRPPSWPSVVRKAQALLECWYPGQEGGTAMAEVLFGDVNPAGRLAVSVVRDAGQVPLTYDALPLPRLGVRSAEPQPLFPFGWGLSYTRFEIGAPRLSAPRIGRDGSVVVEVDVRNTGQRSGDEVVQLYVHDRVASVVRPRLQLRGFERVTLAPGASARVHFTLSARALALWNADMQEVVEPGLFDVLVGPNSRDLKQATLEVV